MTAEQASRRIAADRYPSRVRSEPELLVRADPVLYGAWSPDSPITQARANEYEQKGYLFFESFFSPDEVAAWKAELGRLQRFYREREAEHVIREPDSDEVRSVFAVHDNNPVFKGLAEHKRLTSVARFLLGSDTYVHQSRINFKPGFSGKEFYWHSDFETWHVEDGMPAMRALSVSIALEDNNPYNGPLMVMPGSHKTFVASVGRTPEDHFKQSLRKQEYGVPDKDSLTRLAREGGIDMPVGKAGSLLVFDCNLMHGSSSNISPYPRSNVFIVYNSVENRLVTPFSGQKPRPPFIATRDRE
ncbi:ectoine hydroxylase [Paenibacillus sp. GCM10023250]|uniref:ectoine hydroxylase n=1 Tax=Paenibacillus sp. GCM10023250 TaxID=3252648 RepID=UPI00360BCD9E